MGSPPACGAQNWGVLGNTWPRHMPMCCHVAPGHDAAVGKLRHEARLGCSCGRACSCAWMSCGGTHARVAGRGGHPRPGHTRVRGEAGVIAAATGVPESGLGRSPSLGTQGQRGMGTWGYGATGPWGCRDMGTPGCGITGTRDNGVLGTRLRGLGTMGPWEWGETGKRDMGPWGPEVLGLWGQRDMGQQGPGERGTGDHRGMGL